MSDTNGLVARLSNSCNVLLDDGENLAESLGAAAGPREEA